MFVFLAYGSRTCSGIILGGRGDVWGANGALVHDGAIRWDFPPKIWENFVIWHVRNIARGGLGRKHRFSCPRPRPRSNK